MSFIRRIPLPMSALALGTVGLGNLLSSYSGTLRSACTALAAALALLVLLRIAFDPSGVRAELGNPAALAVLPTLFMTLMLVAAYLRPDFPVPAKQLWIAAVVLHLLTVAYFLARFVVPFKLAQVLPSWFLVFVGFVVASATSPAFSMQPAGRILLLAGLVGYAATLPVVVYRRVKAGALPEPALPTVAILAAPPSLCLVGYLAVVADKQIAVVEALLAIAVASLLYVITHLPRILKLKFLPSFAALTFPFVISATAIKQSSAFLSSTASGSFVPKAAVQTMEVVAAGMVVYVLARYALFLASPQES